MTTTITFEAYNGAPAWNNIGANHLVFSSSLTNLASTIAPLSFNDGTHIGNSTPGTDQCGATHTPNVKLLSATTFSYNGGASQALNDTNLLDTYCTLRLHFNDASNFQVQGGRLYTFDGTTTTNPAVGVDAAAYVKGQSMTQWQTINSNTTTGPNVASMLFQTASIGGNNAGSYVILASQLTNVADHYWYCALSVSPEVSGPKTAFSIGAYFEYF